jgi:menaquinone-dependent protoporphyrinogen oxidase
MAAYPHALVAYATAAGSTAEIAERIAWMLREAGAEAICTPVSPDLDPAGFDVLVVGSAVHDMAWLRPALDFLARAAETGTPIWCFSVGGLAHPYGGRLNQVMARSELQKVARGFPAAFTPRDHRMFSGVVAMDGAPLWARLFYRLTGSGPGDHRDWVDIVRWARRVAEELPRRRPSATDARS